ncbi:MAG TPA: C39 family peptidase [Candidatus Aminicenantes bacterium]|nr:C39 family peptidase [Candidatus Aminicenantes bacterium]
MKQNSRSASIACLAVLAALAAGWTAGTFLPLPLRRRPVPARLLAAVPDVRQSTNYTCGAASLQAVLARWGVEEREDRLAARLHSTPEAGTRPDDIVRVAREFGLSAEVREGLSLSDLEAALAAGISVIVDLQAWRESDDVPWAETWDNGHYMVLLGMDARDLYFEDPALLGARGFIPRAEFVDRWHDYEGEPPLGPSSRRYAHMAIFLEGSGPAPAPPAPFARVR